MGRPKSNKPKDGLSDTVREELDALEVDGLNEAVAAASQAIATAKKELNDNEHYVTAKAKVKDLSSGFRDCKKYQGQKIAYALKRLQVLSGDLEASALD